LRERGIAVDLVLITTTGDQHPVAIPSIGGEGIFTKEIQRALLDGRVDLAVHSLKDLPTGATPGLVLAAVPERAAVADALVCREQEGEKGGGSHFSMSRDARVVAVEEDSRPLLRLPLGARIGTGSLRRRAQLLHARPDLQMKDVRGNVETRLGKLQQGDFDALILAEAGLRRLGLAAHIAEVLPLGLMLPAVGQGALGLETRIDDAATRQIVAVLDDPSTQAAVLAERAMLARLQGGCLAPIGGLGQVEGGQLTLLGRVISHDGAHLLEARQTAPTSQAEMLGLEVAEALLTQGAGEVVRASRGA
jgi:hydroxymethylbilane synthase